MIDKMKEYFNRRNRLSVKNWVTVILVHDPKTFFMKIRLNIAVRIIYIRLWYYKIRRKVWAMD
jgi:hypothetical protein